MSLKPESTRQGAALAVGAAIGSLLLANTIEHNQYSAPRFRAEITPAPLIVANYAVANNYSQSPLLAEMLAHTNPAPSSLQTSFNSTAKIGDVKVKHNPQGSIHPRHHKSATMPNLSTTQGRADFIYTYLSHHGLTKKAAAAALGNFDVEDTGYIPTTPGGYLAQWRGSRYQGLQNFAYNLHQPVTELKVQVSYVLYELKNIFPAVLHNLNAATTPIAAAVVFCWEYESPVPQYANLGKRESIAQTEYNLFAEK